MSSSADDLGMARFQGDHRADPREADPAFRKLPAEVRALVREGWLHDGRAATSHKHRGTLLLWRTHLDALVLFLGVDVLLFYPQASFLLGGVLSALLAAQLWYRLEHIELAAIPAGVLAWLIGFWLLPPRLGGAPVSLLGLFQALAILAGASFALAIARRDRRSGLR